MSADPHIAGLTGPIVHDEIVPASGSAQSQSQLAKVMAARSLG